MIDSHHPLVVGVNGRAAPARRPLAPKGGNDNIYTPEPLAAAIVRHFKPSGRILEPCRGRGAFTKAMPGCDWCEILEGRDFLQVEGRWDWVVTNPPWSKFRVFMNKAMEVADNVVFLSLVNAWFMRARQRDIQDKGFGLVEILEVPVPPEPWPQAGFSLGAGWLRRGWQGAMSYTRFHDHEILSQPPAPLAGIPQTRPPSNCGPRHAKPHDLLISTTKPQP